MDEVEEAREVGEGEEGLQQEQERKK